jgi:beta-glucosidase
MFSRNASFSPPSSRVEKRIDTMIAKLSLEEKIDLLGGKPPGEGTKGNAAAGIPAFRMADGPVGVHWFTKASTTYPALIAAAASWNPDLVYRMGWAIGRDARARGIHMLLAPGVNIYRSALCGRNFEYCGEDPYLADRKSVV